MSPDRILAFAHLFRIVRVLLATDAGQHRPIPVGVPLVAVEAGEFSSFALRADGTIVAWGVDDGSVYNQGQVTETPTDGTYFGINGGSFHSLALETPEPCTIAALSLSGLVLLRRRMRRAAKS